MLREILQDENFIKLERGWNRASDEDSLQDLTWGIVGEWQKVTPLEIDENIKLNEGLAHGMVDAKATIISM